MHKKVDAYFNHIFNMIHLNQILFIAKMIYGNIKRLSWFTQQTPCGGGGEGVRLGLQRPLLAHFMLLHLVLYVVVTAPAFTGQRSNGGCI